LLGGEIKLFLTPGRALDSAVDRVFPDRVLPRANRQIVAIEEEFGDCHEINPAVLRPDRGVAADRPARRESRGRSPVVRWHSHAQHQATATLASDLVQHATNAHHEGVDRRDAFLRGSALEERGKAVEVEFDAVAVVPAHRLLDQTEHMLPHLAPAEVQCPFAQTTIRVVGPEPSAEEVIAVVVVHPECQERFPAAPAGVGQHHGVGVDPGVKELPEVFESPRL